MPTLSELQDKLISQEKIENSDLLKGVFALDKKLDAAAGLASAAKVAAQTAAEQAKVTNGRVSNLEESHEMLTEAQERLTDAQTALTTTLNDPLKGVLPRLERFEKTQEALQVGDIKKAAEQQGRMLVPKFVWEILKYVGFSGVIAIFYLVRGQPADAPDTKDIKELIVQTRQAVAIAQSTKDAIDSHTAQMQVTTDAVQTNQQALKALIDQKKNPPPGQ
jgi:hypothetical protein